MEGWRWIRVRLSVFSALVCVSLVWQTARLQAQGTTTTITATPASLTFQYQMGPAARLPAAQAVAAKSNVAALLVTVSVSGDYNGDWLEPSVRRGGQMKLPASLSVTVTPTSLSAGTYNATITLTGVDDPTVTQTIAVRLIVSSPPSTLRFNPPTGLTFTYRTGSTTPASQRFLMYSDGAPLSVTVSVSGAPWLKLNPTGSVQVGGLYMPITVSIDQTELAKLIPKAYAANITVSAPAATNKSTTYAVTLNVLAEVPLVTDTWPSGVVLNAAGTGSTTVVLDGANFFDTSTVSVTGFTRSTAVTVTDATVPTNLTASEVVSIPVYPAGATFLRLTLGSPLPTGYHSADSSTPYSVDLSTYVSGGTAPYTWTATGLSQSGLTLSTGGILSGPNPNAGYYPVVLTVTDANARPAYLPVGLTVHATATPASGVWITVGSVLPSGVVGTAYTAQLGVAGGTSPYTWTIDADTPWPTGLGIAAGPPATISGTPTTAGLTGNLTQRRLSEGALQVTVPNSYLTQLGFLRMQVHTPAPGGGDSNEAQLEVYGPAPRVLGVGNAASYDSSGVAPGELISIFGTGLGPATLSVYDPTNTTLPIALPTGSPPEGVTGVQISDGSTTWNAALIYTSATQVGAMVPFEVEHSTSLSLRVSYAGLTSQSFPLSVAAAVPGIFTADASGRGQGAILNYNAATNDYSINTAANPALVRNSPIVVLYLTGFGMTSCELTTGGCHDTPVTSTTAAPAGVNTNTAASVTIDGKAAAPLVTGVPAGSFPGLLQLNVTVPADAAAGRAVPVVVSIGAATAQTGVTIALK